MSRNLNDLVPPVKALAEVLIAKSRERGVPIMVTFTLRTVLEQSALWAQGRFPLNHVNLLRKSCEWEPITEAENRRKVTSTMHSMHLYGVAFDIAVLDKDGKPTWDEAFDGDDDKMADYDEVGDIGISLGLSWGFIKSGKRWDKAHFQYTGGLTLEQLEAGERPT